jgi:hypothetical protein
LLAFWYPLNPRTLMPDFNPLYLVAGPAGLVFCLMTPLYLSILILMHPRVNIVTMRVTGLAGALIGFWNVVNFLMYPAVRWWNGVLHILLVVISGYVFILSYARNLKD